MSCSICREDMIKYAKCTTCESNLCQECIISYLESKVGISDINRIFKNGDIKCLKPKCDGVFSKCSIYKIIDDDNFKLFDDQLSRCKTTITEYEAIEEHKRVELLKKEEEEKRSKLDKLVKYVLDDIFTLKCPGCKTSFAEFTGCYALTCGTCGIHFCGWCLKYKTNNSSENHSHILTCDTNISINKKSYHAPIDDFKVSNTTRIKNSINNLANNPLFPQMVEQIKTNLEEYDLVFDNVGLLIVNCIDIDIREMKTNIESLKIKIREDTENKIKDLDFLLKIEPEKALILFNETPNDESFKEVHEKRLNYETKERKKLEKIEKDKANTKAI